ncbi:MAG: hypothetical protein B6241_04810 [Spirochaetaceae bacterium 4572_59]|nr:MAG: hypothetical protein B6241_04810 [Spirochaetaceae bacterium 4572_59]
MNISRWQRKIFLFSWFAYASAYLVRTNISIALPQMAKSLEWNNTTIGIVGSIFFWMYALGQLINGHLGDKVNSKLFIFTGLCVSSLLNIIVGFSQNFFLITILWALNGFFLSMLWGPMVKTFSYWFSKEKQTKIAVGISTSMIGGYLISWGVVGVIMYYTSWQYAFWIPGAIVLIYSFIWLINMKNHPEDVGLVSPNHYQRKVEGQNGAISLIKIIKDTKLWLIAIACIAQGVIKDGITLWGPTFLLQTQDLDPKIIMVLSLFIPFLSLLGIFFAGWLNEKLGFQEKRTIKYLIMGAIFNTFILYLYSSVNVYVSTLAISFAAAFMYGANSLLLTIIPLKYLKYHKVSAVAGFLDFSSYMGAALTGVLTGFMVDKFGWTSIFLLWSVFAVSGIVSIAISGKYEKQSMETLESLA